MSPPAGISDNTVVLPAMSFAAARKAKSSKPPPPKDRQPSPTNTSDISKDIVIWDDKLYSKLRKEHKAAIAVVNEKMNDTTAKWQGEVEKNRELEIQLDVWKKRAEDAERRLEQVMEALSDVDQRMDDLESYWWAGGYDECP